MDFFSRISSLGDSSSNAYAARAQSSLARPDGGTYLPPNFDLLDDLKAAPPDYIADLNNMAPDLPKEHAEFILARPSLHYRIPDVDELNKSVALPSALSSSSSMLPPSSSANLSLPPNYTIGLPEPPEVQKQKEQYVRMLGMQVQAAGKVLEVQFRSKQMQMHKDAENRKKKYSISVDADVQNKILELQKEYAVRVSEITATIAEQKKELEIESMRMGVEWESRKLEKEYEHMDMEWHQERYKRDMKTREEINLAHQKYQPEHQHLTMDTRAIGSSIGIPIDITQNVNYMGTNGSKDALSESTKNSRKYTVTSPILQQVL